VKKNRIFILMLPLLIGVTYLYACANTASVARQHPQEVKGLVNCAECHDNQWGVLNHKADDFYRKHKFYAGQQKPVCSSCHKESFCADCHAHKEEIKPGDKYKDSPERTFPHRGDYQSRHRIEGKINPASCFKCHGRQNNERCKTCHR
jgi:hypothetical protein